MKQLHELCMLHSQYLPQQGDAIYREMPGELERVMIWFRDYKIPDGKPANAYGYDSRPMNSDFAKMVIGETHELYNDLKEGKRENNGKLALS